MALGKDHQLILEHILGLMVMDTEGKLVYINRQCADYIKVDQEKSMDQDINEVFPPSKMKGLLHGDKNVNTEFYFYDGRMSVSAQSQIRRDGKVVGVLEYDIIQDIDSLDELLGKYAISLKDEMKYYREQFRKLSLTKYSIDNIMGKSKCIQDLIRQIKFAASTNSTVIITGETGTGKELVAHAIHNLSGRAFGGFIKINAASLPESLAESEFFGYDEGAFTGAKKGGKKGKFELANDGTLFIDEINQMSLNLQPKILRALQEHEIDRVGGEESIKINARIIAATNEDLGKLVKEGRFREDLFYRLNVFPIHVPPLRERLEDLPELVAARVEQLNQELGKSVTNIDKKVHKLLQNHLWPGNVRELFNMVEKAMNYVEGQTLLPEHFDFVGHVNRIELEEIATMEKPIDVIKNQAEKQLIIQVLEMFEGNKTKAANYLKIPRPLLYQKIKRLNII